MVWTVERDDQNNYEYNVSAWSSEDDALKEATHEIILHLNKRYNAADPDLIQVVQQISDLLKAKKYKAAIGFWNDCDYNVDSGSPVYWNVCEYQVKSYKHQTVNASFDPSRFPFLNPASQQTAPVNGVVNDHTCTNCGNNRCSKKEKSCWVCGAKI